MRYLTMRMAVKLLVRVNGDWSDDEIVQRITENCDYSFEYEDDDCKIEDTEIVDATLPSLAQYAAAGHSQLACELAVRDDGPLYQEGTIDGS